MTDTAPEYTIAQIRDHLRANHPELEVGKRGRISESAHSVFLDDVAAGRVHV